MTFRRATIAARQNKEKTFNVPYISQNIPDDRSREHHPRESETNVSLVGCSRQIVLKLSKRSAVVYRKLHHPSSSGKMPSVMVRNTRNVVWIQDVVGINLRCGETVWERAALAKKKIHVKLRS